MKKHFLLPGNITKIRPFKKYKEITGYANNPFSLLKCILKKTDEVIALTPYLPSVYQELKSICSISCVTDISEIAPSTKTKAIFLSNPNPLTGRVYKDDGMISLIEIVKKNNLYLIVDETESIFYKKFRSFTFYKDLLFNRLIIFNRLSYKNNDLSMVYCPKGVYKKNHFIASKSLIRFYQSKKLLKKREEIKNINYFLLADFCEKNNIIYMKNSKASFLVMNINRFVMENKNIKVYYGEDIGMTESYIAISLIDNPKKIKQMIKRFK